VLFTTWGQTVPISFMARAERHDAAHRVALVTDNPVVR
jgi:hypothetical protein